MSGSQSGPLLQAARLWERTSAKGSRYMSGRLGGVKVLILEHRAHDPNDPANSHTHNLVFADGTPAQPRPAQGVVFNGRTETSAPPPANDVPPWEPSWEGKPDPPPHRAPQRRGERRASGGGGKARLPEDAIPWMK